MTTSPFTSEKQACPTCTARGEDTSGDNLHLRKDGSGYCFACSKNFTQEDLSGEAPEPRAAKSGLSVKDILSFPLGADPKRGLSDETVSTYEVRASLD